MGPKRMQTCEGRHIHNTARVSCDLLAKNNARTPNLVQGGTVFSFYLYLAMAVRSEAPLAVGFAEAPLVAISGATLGLAAADGFLDSASWIPPWLLYGSLVIPRLPPSGLASCSAFAFFHRSFSVLCWPASHVEIRA